MALSKNVEQKLISFQTGWLIRKLKFIIDNMETKIAAKIDKFNKKFEEMFESLNKKFEKLNHLCTKTFC